MNKNCSIFERQYFQRYSEKNPLNWFTVDFYGIIKRVIFNDYKLTNNWLIDSKHSRRNCLRYYSFFLEEYLEKYSKIVKKMK